MKSLVVDGIEAYALEKTRPEPELLTRLEAQTRAEMENPQMLTGRLEGRLLKLLVQICRPKLVVELGTFTGYSALSMAEGLPDGGRIITCEVNPVARDIAQAAFDRSPFGQRIEIRMGPALDTLRGIDEPIDFAFVDADKENYPAYYEEVLKRTRSGGVIVFDNMLWSGRVLEPGDDDDRAIADLNDAIVNDERVENVLLTVRDGVQLIVRK
ncbi:MAG: O-methyltransferase [Gammaproteobacteria bacterium]